MNSAAILVLNSGSSSLKFALYEVQNLAQPALAGPRAEFPAALLVGGEASEIGKPEARLRMLLPRTGESFNISASFADSNAAAAAVFAQWKRYDLPRPVAVGHRLVTGGSEYVEPVRITPEVVARLRALTWLAPLHLPSEIALVEAMVAQCPGVPQIACFDTAFHHSMPLLAQKLPLPREFFADGIRRYGFHGLSYEYVVEKLGAAAANRRVIIAHLGNGSSLAAVRDGRPIDTTMGFTPAGGVMMGTRPGDLDPGVLLYLLREKRYDPSQLEDLIEYKSGLLGVSGISADMKMLLERRSSDPAAAEAVELFCYLVRKQIGALAAVLGGLDMLVFTGGIGEHAAPVREMICEGLEFLGIRLDRGRNNRGEESIGVPDCPCLVRVVATNEELMIARHTGRSLFAAVSAGAA